MAEQIIINESIAVPTNHSLYISNAGLVILSPYLPTLFNRLGLLSKNEEGLDRIDPNTSASRAVRILDYLVTGQPESPEHILQLSKLICGLPIEASVDSGIQTTPEELEICDSLLQAVIGQWTALGGTSVDGLRETFLQREGSLYHDHERWNLQIERKTLDILLDQIPWSFSIVSFPWMAEPIYVEW